MNAIEIEPETNPLQQTLEDFLASEVGDPVEFVEVMREKNSANYFWKQQNTFVKVHKDKKLAELSPDQITQALKLRESLKVNARRTGWVR